MMLRAENLFKTYPGDPRSENREGKGAPAATPSGSVTAVAGVSVNVSAGEFLAICGRSGSGKSTLLALLSGLTAPSGGTVSIDGTDLFALSRNDRTRVRRSRIGVVFQFTGLLPTLRAIDNVAFPALIANSTDGADPYQRAAELLAQVGLAHRREAYPHELSGGEQRRVALARALINAPPLLLCDEPTSDLDATTASEVRALLVELHRRHGTTLVVVTHDENLARAADRILYLERGRIESAAPPSPVPVPPSSSVPSTAPPVAARPVAVPRPSTERLGAGFGKLLARFVLALALGTCAVAAVDWGTGLYQRQQQDKRLHARRLLEETALQQLRADIERLGPGADGSFSLALYLQNLDPDAPLFVTAPAVRTFVQVDRDWVEVPAQVSEVEADGVLNLSGKRVFRFTFKPEVARYTELIPGYMHVRFRNAMLIGRERTGVGGLFERTDDYYVYLKPPGADDAAVCRKNQWASAPLWIAMPPH
jgi:putative ABC transport system ATP-binding protein/macrolide transport system ATP-binding/permease protein/lipoprotein-releasing system ATP-binding protein